MNVLFIVTRNEADLLRLNLAHHLAWGFDQVAIADNESTDATRDVLGTFGDVVTVESIPNVHHRFASVRRLLGRIEARHGPCDWVAFSDTDEFWWQPGTDLKGLLATVPPGAIGLNTEQKLFLPVATDPTDGPVYVRRTWRCSGPESPLHTSYRRGKSIYRAGWLRQHELTSAHWCRAVPVPPWRPPQPLVHHYMIDGEDAFLEKVLALERWSPEVRDPSAVSGPQADERPGARGPKVLFRDYKLGWWRIYEAGGEAAVRDYYRTTYQISAEALPGCVQRGELVRDTAFADYMRNR